MDDQTPAGCISSGKGREGIATCAAGIDAAETYSGSGTTHQRRRLLFPNASAAPATFEPQATMNAVAWAGCLRPARIECGNPQAPDGATRSAMPTATPRLLELGVDLRGSGLWDISRPGKLRPAMPSHGKLNAGHGKGGGSRTAGWFQLRWEGKLMILLCLNLSMYATNWSNSTA